MKKLLKLIALTAFLAFLLNSAHAQDDEDKSPMKASTFSGLKLRLIGPALTSGRISDLAVDPNDRSYYFVGVASGGVWKTTNGGVTFDPVFDSQGSYSIGCVTLDPDNREIVWVGTGENNSQRSVGYGDGVYKSTDGGKSWKHMGLKESEHIGKIIIDPNNSNVVYVAAQGPLWGPGGDRGLYKSTDGGENWEKSLYISENTGVSDLVMDPRDPDVLYCSAYQRRRHVFTLINGGPESAVYKTTDAGKNWFKIHTGLPSVDLGRVGLAISPANPDIVYAIVEAAEDKGGIFRTTNRGGSWEKMNDYISSSPQYYQELVADPKDPDMFYSLDTYSRWTDDGGKTIQRLPLKNRHVDDHALFIDPNNTNYLLIGGDGGLYESYDRGQTWRFFENLPVTQFYRIQADNSEPFYYVYGGTQDNNSLGAPSRTTSRYGIMNQDWFYLVGGDGYEVQIDPEDPNIVYGQWQYGGLVRYDRRSGEVTGIKPQPERDEELRWNWDAPVLISPHKHTRLYFAANKIFKSEDRGNSWKRISGDLTRQIDRNELEVMGKVWSPEAVSKNASTSLYGNIVSLAESPLKEGLLYAGTDDGLIQVTEDMGKSWRKTDVFPGVPETSYVADIYPSRHNADVVYAIFNNHKNSDFKPYLLKSMDKGKSWESITADLPDNEPLWTIEEDHADPNLLFVGTEFSLYFTNNGGSKWIELKGGFPVIAVRDLDIQERENDLVVGTFGRGIYILDDYTPLRHSKESDLEAEAKIFPIKDSWMYTQMTTKARGREGETFYKAENPEFGAAITYYLKEPVKTLKQERKEKEKEIRESKDKKYEYPTFGRLAQEDSEDSPYLLFVINDAEGNEVRKLKAPPSTGLNRITWDLKYASTNPVNEKTDINKHSGFPVLPGTYSVTMYKFIRGEFSKLAGPVEFNTKVLDNTTLPAPDRNLLDSFYKDVQELTRAVYGLNEYLSDIKERIGAVRTALKVTPEADLEMLKRADRIDSVYHEVNLILNGNKTKSSRNANSPMSLSDRLGNILWSIWQTSSAPTQTNLDSYDIAEEQLNDSFQILDDLVNQRLLPLEEKMNEMNAPYTPGRFPDYRRMSR